ncbi:hypothetical protein L9F63_027351, partial [Diploptera punctata]
ISAAGHDLGRQLALEFWRHGCTVVCVDTDQNANNLTAHNINTRHHRNLQNTEETKKERCIAAYAYTCDVRDRIQVATLASRVQQDVGQVDILVNNTGIKPLLHVEPAKAVDVVNVNLLSHFWMVLAFLPSMVKRNEGHVIAISSVADLCGLANKEPHSASKYPAAGFMKALSKEMRLDSHNIKFTCAYSYFVNSTTDLPEQLDLRIPELSPEHAAIEIVNAVRHNIDTITVPKSLLFWLNVFRTLPQDARDVWRDLFHTRAVPTELPIPPTYMMQVPSEGIKT